MSSKPVLMIHEVSDAIFQLPLEDYILTFDDGLYSQYYHWPKFKEINTEKIFFISSGIVCNGTQSLDFPSCETAHAKAYTGKFEDYMTLAQIKELSADPLVTIGCHGHDHKRLANFKTLADKVKYISTDTRNMLAWCSFNLGYIPTAFCFPHNDDLRGIYRAMLAKVGFTNFYGDERIPVETLLHNPPQLDSHGV